MKKTYKNATIEKIREYLLKTIYTKDISRTTEGLTAPCLLIKNSSDNQMIEITNFDADSGKHYSGWYFMPISYQAFEQRLLFNKMKLIERL